MHYSQFLPFKIHCADIKLNSKSSDISDILSNPNLKSSDILSDGSAKHILRPGVHVILDYSIY